MSTTKTELLRQAIAAFVMTDEERALHFDARAWCAEARAALSEPDEPPPCEPVIDMATQQEQQEVRGE